MKARLGSIRKVGLFYPYGALTSPKALVYSPAGTLLATIPLVASNSISNLYLANTANAVQSVKLTGPGSDPPTPIGFYTVRYTSGDTVIYVDTLVVGKDPTPDFPVSSSETPIFRLSDEEVGNATSTVAVKILTDTDVAVSTSTATKALFKGTTDVSVVVLPDEVLAGVSDLVFRVDSDSAADDKTVDFKATQLVVTGDTDAGQFVGADATTTATYSVNGGPTRTLDLSTVIDGMTYYAYTLNEQMRGVSVTINQAGTGLVLTTDVAGTSAAVTVTPQGNWEDKTGLSGVYTADASLNNVANADAVTFEEIKLRIESDVMTTLVGDLLEVTKEASTNKLILTSKGANTGISSTITLVSGNADLKTALGISDLAKKAGTAAGAVVAPFEDRKSVV